LVGVVVFALDVDFAKLRTLIEVSSGIQIMTLVVNSQKADKIKASQ
jgi:hypothetical protein